MSADQPLYAKPYYIFFLVLPAGMAMGFGSVTLPYLLTKNGFPVAVTAGIVAFSVSANLYRFIWGPIADLTLTLRKWYWISTIACVVSLLLLCITPLNLKGGVLITGVSFLSQLAATFVMLPVGSFMANRIEDKRKGAAAGWFQSGNLGGVGLGGGLGLWLATHFSVAVAGIVLCTASIGCALFVQKIQDVKPEGEKKIGIELLSMGKDILSMIRVPVILFVVIMLASPIGSGGAANLWSAIANDWKVSADTVALITGILSGLVGVAGSVAGGYMADRLGNWIAYLGAGVIGALVAIVMAFSPQLPYVYIVGVLAYMFALGLMNAAFSSVILYVIGKRNASTKYSLLSSLGNLPVVYMTAVDGLAHDHFNSKIMLLTEAGICLLFVVIYIFVIQILQSKKLMNPVLD